MQYTIKLPQNGEEGLLSIYPDGLKVKSNVYEMPIMLSDGRYNIMFQGVDESRTVGLEELEEFQGINDCLEADTERIAEKHDFDITF